MDRFRKGLVAAKVPLVGDTSPASYASIGANFNNDAADTTNATDTTNAVSQYLSNPYWPLTLMLPLFRCF